MTNRNAPDHAAEALLGLLRALEERLLAPEVRASQDAVADLLADGFVEFGRSGRIYDKRQTVAALAAEIDQNALAERSASDFRINLLAPGVALVTYRSARRNAPHEVATHSLRSSIWKQIDGRWQMAFHQGTPTADLSG